MTMPSARILLVDDDPAILQLVATYLKSIGHQVCASDQPGHVLSEARHQPMEFDLLISDIVMPVLEGHELANQLREFNPNLGVILMSGHSDARVEVTRRVRFLRKPFRLRLLDETIRDVLAAVEAARVSDNITDTNPQIAVYFDTSQTLQALVVPRTAGSRRRLSFVAEAVPEPTEGPR